jgi:hypothetical protein
VDLIFDNVCPSTNDCTQKMLGKYYIETLEDGEHRMHVAAALHSTFMLDL